MLNLEKVRNDLREGLGDFRIDDLGDVLELTLPFYDYLNNSFKIYLTEFDNGIQVDDGGSIITGPLVEDEKLIGKVISLCKTYRGYYDRLRHMVSVRAGILELSSRIIDHIHILVGICGFVRVFCMRRKDESAEV